MNEQKTAQEVCAYCGEATGDESVRRGHLVYCSEACAFEASRSVDCGGRTDTINTPPAAKPSSSASGE